MTSTVPQRMDTEQAGVSVGWQGSGRRTGWGLVDQALSSLTNFAVVVLVAHSVSSSELGAFSLAFAVYIVMLGALRAVALHPMLVRSSDLGREGDKSSEGAVTGLALDVGVAVGAVACAAGLLVRGTLGDTLVPLGLALPGLLIQDACRAVFFARGRPALAAANDAVWAVAQFALIGVVLAVGHAGPVELVSAWGAAGVVAGVVGIWQGRIRARPESALAWFRRNQDLGLRFGAEFAAVQGSSQVNLVILGGIAGLGAVGIYRAAVVLLNPTNVVNLALPLVAIPEAVRAMRRPRGLAVVTRTVSLCVVILFGIWAVIALSIPSWVGHLIVGKSWPGARHVLPALVVGLLADGLSAGAIIGLRARAAAQASLRVQLLLSVLVLTLGPIGAAADGAVGTAWVIAAISALEAIALWITFAGVQRRAMEVQPL